MARRPVLARQTFLQYRALHHAVAFCGFKPGAPDRGPAFRHPGSHVGSRPAQGLSHTGPPMNATAKLQELGQSLWLDNISRNMIDTGLLETYIRDFSITGLTSNPSIF